MEDRTVEEVMDEKILAGLNALDSLEVGTDEYSKAVNAVNQLISSKNNATKIEYEDENNRRKSRNDVEFHEKEIELKNLQISNEKRKTWTDVALNGLGLLGWFGMSCIVMNFEKTGFIKSKAFTGTLPKFRIKK